MTWTEIDGRELQALRIAVCDIRDLLMSRELDALGEYTSSQQVTTKLAAQNLTDAELIKHLTGLDDATIIRLGGNAPHTTPGNEEHA